MQISTFHFSPDTTSHFELISPGCTRNGSPQAGKSHELGNNSAKAKSLVLPLNPRQTTRWENQGQEQRFVLPAWTRRAEAATSSSTCAPFPAGGIPEQTSQCHLPALLNPLKVSTEGMSTTYGYQFSVGPSIPPPQLGEQFTAHKFIQQISAHVLFAKQSVERLYFIPLGFLASIQAPDPDLFAIGQEPHFISAGPRLRRAISEHVASTSHSTARTPRHHRGSPSSLQHLQEAIRGVFCVQK